MASDKKTGSFVLDVGQLTLFGSELIDQRRLHVHQPPPALSSTAGQESDADKEADLASAMEQVDTKTKCNDSPNDQESKQMSPETSAAKKELKHNKTKIVESRSFAIPRSLPGTKSELEYWRERSMELLCQHEPGLIESNGRFMYGGGQTGGLVKYELDDTQPAKIVAVRTPALSSHTSVD